MAHVLGLSADALRNAEHDCVSHGDLVAVWVRVLLLDEDLLLLLRARWRVRLAELVLVY